MQISAAHPSYPLQHTAAPANPPPFPPSHHQDHIIRAHGRHAAGDATFVALNLALWGVDAAAFRRFWLPGSPDALPNVQLLLGMVRGATSRYVTPLVDLRRALFPACGPHIRARPPPRPRSVRTFSAGPQPAVTATPAGAPGAAGREDGRDGRCRLA
jgi:hypothetical protein